MKTTKGKRSPAKTLAAAMKCIPCMKKVLVIFEHTVSDASAKDFRSATCAMSSDMTAEQILFLMEVYKMHLMSLITNTQEFDQS